jgi:hypothetical protein
VRGTRNANKILIEKSQSTKPLHRLVRTLENDIKVALRETRSKGVDWIQMSQDKAGPRIFMKNKTNIPVPEIMQFLDQLINYQVFKKTP